MEELRIDPTIAYDVIELPSKGIHYTNGKKSIRVAYLTASDENILSSPSLISSNTMVTELLRRKILDRDISIDDMVEEDRQAILIFLRNTSFGSEYNYSILDPKTQKEFDITVDLSEIKVKDFNLEADVNGEYKYYLEKSKTDITFKFMNQKQQSEVDKIRDSWNGNGIAPVMTKQLEFMIKSVGGIRDGLQIRNFIEKMPIKDSQDFRKFIKENKPGLDLTKTVKTPSGDEIQINIGFGVEFFRPFFGI